jgi:exonuclease III
MIEKALTLASLNVRGLRGNKSKPKQVRSWLASLPTPPQIILMQEHHLGKVDTQDPARGLEFWQGILERGHPMGRSQRMSADTTILVDKATAPFITDHGTLVEGHAQYVTMQSPGNGALTIINVYAPCSSNDRAPL